METLKFKSNIKCTGCLEKVTPHLNETSGIESWNVDLANPERVLTVQGKGISSEKVNEALRKAGYSAEPIC